MSPPLVSLQPLLCSGKESIGMVFSSNSIIEWTVRKMPGVRYSLNQRCWYLPLSKESYLLIKQVLKDKASIDSTSLKTYLEQRKVMQPIRKTEVVAKERAALLIQYPLSTDNLKAFESFCALLKLKGYSPNTMKSYANEFHLLLRLLGTTPVGTLTKRHLQSYLLWLLKERRYSETHLHLTINALKFYFEQVERREKEFYDLPRPRKPLKLPDILAESEVVKLIQKTGNLKHKALLMCAYAAGLRVSELVSLKIVDIDSLRMTLHIRRQRKKRPHRTPFQAAASNT